MFLTTRQLCFSVMSALILVGPLAWSNEENSSSSKPSIFFDRLFLQPEAQLNEPSTGGLGPLLWAVGLKSEFAPWVDVRASVGATQLLYLPTWATAPSGFVTLVEGVGTV